MIHPTAEVSDQAVIGENTRVWNETQVLAGARIGANSNIGKGAYIDEGVIVGDNVKIQNNCTLSRGSTLESGVFLGPCVTLTNDPAPRAIHRDGRPKNHGEWSPGRILIREGASIGTNTVVLPNVVIGRFAMVGAGSVVTEAVPDHVLVVGSPAREIGFVCYCGTRLAETARSNGRLEGFCPTCDEQLRIDLSAKP